MKSTSPPHLLSYHPQLFFFFFTTSCVLLSTIHSSISHLHPSLSQQGSCCGFPEFLAAPKSQCVCSYICCRSKPIWFLDSSGHAANYNLALQWHTYTHTHLSHLEHHIKVVQGHSRVGVCVCVKGRAHWELVDSPVKPVHTKVIRIHKQILIIDRFQLVQIFWATCWAASGNASS